MRRVPRSVPETGVRVNQIGYFPDGAKLAVAVSASPAPLPWRLEDSRGAVLAEGRSVPFGLDQASGLSLHRVDFSAFRGEVCSARLRCGEEVSHSFAVAPALYGTLRMEAFRFFYLNRSGSAVVLPRSGGSDWCRRAAHAPDIAAVPPEWGGGFRDVTGGWYDAGNHGKYAVTGALALWTLQSLDEWGLWAECGGDLPALREECRHELDFLLSLRIPEGCRGAGLAFHKVVDRSWTDIPLDPANDAEERHLFAPSAAATLDVAAVAAQASRIWRAREPDFAAALLALARKSWDAARGHPDLHAAKGDPQGGGGAFADGDSSDEFYWAACELFLASGDADFADSIERSPHFLSARPEGRLEPRTRRSSPLRKAFDWQDVQALGTIALASGPLNPYSARARVAVIKAGLVWLGQSAGGGFPAALERLSCPGGSNSVVLNKALEMALASDFSDDRDLSLRLRTGVVRSLDYILGCNALDLSQVTGFGERCVRFPHHRFWAGCVDPSYPLAPPGCLVGGPNSETFDPAGEAARLSVLPPQRCHLDDISSWATNEVAINWNAPLVWVTAWLGRRSGR